MPLYPYTLTVYPYTLIPLYPIPLYLCIYPIYPYTLIPLYPYTFIQLYHYTLMPLRPYVYPYTLILLDSTPHLLMLPPPYHVDQRCARFTTTSEAQSTIYNSDMWPTLSCGPSPLPHGDARRRYSLYDIRSSRIIHLIWQESPWRWTFRPTYIYLSTFIPVCFGTFIASYLYTVLALYLYTFIPLYLHIFIPLYVYTFIPLYLYFCSLSTCVKLPHNIFTQIINVKFFVFSCDSNSAEAF